LKGPAIGGIRRNENRRGGIVIETQTYSGEERRARDRARGIVLRRRRNELPSGVVERRRAPANDGFDIASALELHLDQCTTRRAMLNLLEQWLAEAKNPEAVERDDGYARAVQHAIDVMKTSPDVLTGIAVLQRRSES
jgi:hypothetical protein